MTSPVQRSARLFAAACALAFVLAHVPWLPSTLEDIDSVNFALGLRRFDVAAHRPHPPGYPAFIALGKVTRGAIAAAAAPGTGPDAIDARTLALLGVVFGGLLAFPLLQVFRMLEPRESRARAALLVALACPLLWFTASRPLSDVVGLSVATASQAVLLTAWRRQRRRGEMVESGDAEAADPAQLVASGRLIVLGALMAGAAVGFRSQSAWLTVPVLLFVLADRAGRGAAGAVLGSAITFGLGVLTWALPLVVVSGGPAAYAAALSSQAGEDIAGVDLLATNISLRRVAAALAHTFLDPWQSWWLAGVVLVLAVAGALVMLVRARPSLAMVAAMTIPYLVFHLAFHETFTTRYALPLMPVVALLAVRGLAVVHERAVVPGAVVLVVAGLALTVPSLVAYARAGSPLARAIADLRADGGATSSRVGMHHAFALALRDEPFAGTAFGRTPKREWEEVARYWRNGGRVPVQFLADPRRTDLAAIDPAAQRLEAQYRWPFDPTRLLGGVRPSNVDLVRMSVPGWLADRGAALTPELAGMSTIDRRGPARGGVTFWVRRRVEAATLMIGGRNLGKADGPDVRFDLAIDGRPVRAWRVRPQPGFFLDLWTLDAGAIAGEGAFVPFTVTAEAADGSRRAVDASIEQFDLQPVASPVSGFDAGWHEQEYQPATGRTWRWSSEAATLRVHETGAALRCRVEGESSLRYFDKPSRVVLRAGSVQLGETEAGADFVWEVHVPPDALRAAGGMLTLVTDQTFVPHERTANGDRRRLGLRIYSVTLSAVPAQSR